MQKLWLLRHILILRMLVMTWHYLHKLILLVLLRRLLVRRDLIPSALSSTRRQHSIKVLAVWDFKNLAFLQLIYLIRSSSASSFTSTFYLLLAPKLLIIYLQRIKADTLDPFHWVRLLCRSFNQVSWFLNLIPQTFKTTLLFLLYLVKRRANPW